MKKNIIAIPPYYSGTSFEDIVNSLILSAKKSKFDIQFIGSLRPLQNNIKSKNLLDDDRYIKGQYKLLSKIDNLIDVEKILFLDFFNPGLDLLKYSLVQKDRNIMFGSLLHGGSFVPGDLYSDHWIRNFECGWFDINDTVYVPSMYLKETCPEIYKDKVRIFSWGMDSFDIINNNLKKWDVIYPHRLQSDKGAQDLVELLIKAPVEMKFLITSPLRHIDLEDNEFYVKLRNFKNVEFEYSVNNENISSYLVKSKVVLSCSYQETFGYSVMKSILCGCIPVVPGRASYPEYFGYKYIYHSTEDAIVLLQKILSKDYILDENFEDLRSQINNFSFVPLLDDFFKARSAHVDLRT